MHTKRIIPCLDVKDGKVVKGINFVGLKEVGDPVDLARAYYEQGADELVFLDITATHEQRDTMVQVVERVAREIFIPFTVGGGIRSVEDIRKMLLAGADKVSLNSAAVRNKELIRQGAGILLSTEMLLEELNMNCTEENRKTAKIEKVLESGENMVYSRWKTP